MNKFRFWCQNVLPLTFDDSISYYECLCKVKNVVNSIVDNLNNMENEWERYTDDQIKKLVTKLDKKISDFENTVNESLQSFIDQNNHFQNDIQYQINEQNNNINKFKNYIQTQLHLYEQEMKILENSLLVAIDEMGEVAVKYTDHMIELEATNREISDQKLQDQIDDLKKLLHCGDAYNPTSGRIEPVSKTLIDIYNADRWGGLTVEEYNELGLTCEQINEMEKSVLWWDTMARTILEKKRYNEHGKMFSPVTGKYVPVSQAVIDLFNVLNINGKTVEEYNALDITVGEFNSSDFDVFTQDTNKQWHTVDVDLKNKEIETYQLLWQNENPNYPFNKQNIPIDTSTYDVFKIFYNNKQHGTIDRQNSSYLTNNNMVNHLLLGYAFSLNSILYFPKRIVVIGDGTLNFEHGLLTRIDNNVDEQDDTAIVPLKIYGIKYKKGFLEKGE